MLGAVDPRDPFASLLMEDPAVARAANYRVFAVRWPVFAGVDAEGLLSAPTARPKPASSPSPTPTRRPKRSSRNPPDTSPPAVAKSSSPS